MEPAATALWLAVAGGLLLVAGVVSPLSQRLVYLAAIVVGAGRVPYRAGVRRVHDGLAWLSQLGMFLMLGLLVYPTRLWPYADEGLVLAVVARPVAHGDTELRGGDHVCLFVPADERPLVDLLFAQHLDGA